MEKKFVANKALLVDEDGKILLLRYSGSGDHKNSEGKLDVPGGRMDAGEHPLEGLEREVLEETGIHINPRLASPIYVDLWGVMGDIQNQPIVGIYYRVPIENTESINLSEEHKEVVWFDPTL